MDLRPTREDLRVHRTGRISLQALAQVRQKESNVTTTKYAMIKGQGEGHWVSRKVFFATDGNDHRLPTVNQRLKRHHIESRKVRNGYCRTGQLFLSQLVARVAQ